MLNDTRKIFYVFELDSEIIEQIKERKIDHMVDVLDSVARQAFSMANQFINSGETFRLTRPFIFGEDHQPNDNNILVAMTQIYNALVAGIMIQLSLIKTELTTGGCGSVELFELVNVMSVTRYGVMVYMKS